ncbi:MAG: hypothetical protein JW779_11320, partial [Candidatus Thorarchaeota archaeon]|nr:hypothetical protein [Candidatus Thorarchaeota archaeon]
VTNYCMLPRRDLGISVTRREKFASGMKNERESTEPEQEEQSLFATRALSNVHWLRRHPVLYFGHPLDTAGNVLSRSYVTTEINHLNMHVIVAGITQSGKSTTLQSVFGQAITLGVNPIQFNPSKSYETRRLMNLFDDVRYFTCGRDDIANLLFNLWTPPANVPLSKWVDRVVQAWTLWLPNDEIMSMHFEKIVYTMYERCGWVPKTNTIGRPILISDLIEALEEEETRLEYGDEVSSNVFGALVERIRSILRKHTIVGMFNTKSGITVFELLSHPTIIDMDALSHNEKILLMGILTAAICEYKLANPTQDLTNLLILEEAHYILGRHDANGEAYSGARLQAVSAFIEMVRVVGGTGLGVVIADQSPTSLVPEVMKIIVNMIIHALPDKADRELVGNHMRCTESQIDHIGGMRVGEAVVYLQHEGTPKNVMMFPLERFITDEIPQARVDDEGIREHMKKILKRSPEIEQSIPPHDHLQPVKKNKPKKNTDLSPEIKKRITEALASADFKTFWEEHLTVGDVTTLVSMIRRIMLKAGDGSPKSYLHAFERLVDVYCFDDNIHVFNAIAAI